MPIPSPFLDRLQAILPEEKFEKILESFSCAKLNSVRLNALLPKKDEILTELKKDGYRLKRITWLPDAYEIEPLKGGRLSDHPGVGGGKVYIQNCSSMIPVLLLEPQPGERVLDMCAAPGSKSTQIAAVMNNTGELVCVDAVRSRVYKLKSVLKRYGVIMSRVICCDGRRFRSPEPFDRILLDAPCSSEGRFRTDDPKTFRYWSPRKIKEMVRKQRGLLLNAFRHLKPGGVMVYSTCTFAPEENEGVMDWLLKKSDGQAQLVKVDLKRIESCPTVKEWNKREYHSEVDKTFRVFPTDLMDGFFVAKIKKKER